MSGRISVKGYRVKSYTRKAPRRSSNPFKGITGHTLPVRRRKRTKKAKQ